MNLREHARQNGQTFFFTNKPCKNGHLSKRYVSTGGCYDCLKNSNRNIINKYAKKPTIDGAVLHEDQFVAARSFLDALLQRNAYAELLLGMWAQASRR